MYVSPIDFKAPNMRRKIQNGQINNEKPKNLTFKGSGEHILSFYTLDMSNLLHNPTFVLQNELLNDGFELKAIKKWGIYSVPEPEPEPRPRVPYLINSSENGTSYISVPKNDTGSLIYGVPKKREDILAMYRVYQYLKEDFIDEDVEKFAEAFSQVDKVLEDIMGMKASKDKHTKSLMLQILSYTNKYNEPIIKSLMQDKNFNNINIAQAISSIQDKEKACAAAHVLKEAKEIGYGKEFSLPLAIMLNEATLQNLPVIRKALTEQEFLTTEKEFVKSGNFATFLKHHDYLALAYIKNDEMSLNDVQELMEMSEEAGEFDDSEDLD